VPWCSDNTINQSIDEEAGEPRQQISLQVNLPAHRKAGMHTRLKHAQQPIGVQQIQVPPISCAEIKSRWESSFGPWTSFDCIMSSVCGNSTCISRGAAQAAPCCSTLPLHMNQRVAGEHGIEHKPHWRGRNRGKGFRRESAPGSRE
jgi:hypothetical protein